MIFETGNYAKVLTTNGLKTTGYLIHRSYVRGIDSVCEWFVFPFTREDDAAVTGLLALHNNHSWESRNGGHSWYGIPEDWAITQVETILEIDTTNLPTLLHEKLHVRTRPVKRRGRKHKMKIPEASYGTLDGDD